MGVDVRTHLDFFDFYNLLLLARLGGLLLVGIFQLAQIEDLADWRIRIGSDFDEVEAGLLGEKQCVVDGDIAAVVAVGVDELDAGDPDIPV
jgi:hypothetical protein